MKTREDLIGLRDLYSTRVKDARKFINKFKGTASESEWIAQFYMAAGKIEVLEFLLKDSIDLKIYDPKNIETVTCHDCGAIEGEFHNHGCDMEICPFCGGQLISCSCIYNVLGYQYDSNKEYCGLPKEIYKNGLSKEQEKEWINLLEKKKRIRWIEYPNICAKCGEVWPELFSVPNEEWQRYIQKSEQDKVICINCYNFIKECIDSNK
jgi:hypothetical protein